MRSQYAMIKESRAVVFDFLQGHVKDNINTALTSFHNKSIAYLYLHIANTYIAWAGNFALGDLAAFHDQESRIDLTELVRIFENVDQLMFRFSAHFSEDPHKPVEGYKWPEKYIQINAFGIFTHVISHEFHHKGQAMTMARQLGHVPPDTDIMRF